MAGNLDTLTKHGQLRTERSAAGNDDMETRMTDLALVRYHLPGVGPRIGVLREKAVYDVTDALGSVADWLRSSVGGVQAAVDALDGLATSAKDCTEVARLDQAPAPTTCIGCLPSTARMSGPPA